MSLETPSRWLLTSRPRPQATSQILCFHHAGGGASSFAPWNAVLRPDTELLAVQLPGRENRFGEPLMADAAGLFDALDQALAGRLGPDFIVFGHSLGALLAYAWTRRRMSGPDPAPKGLIVSAAPPPGSGGWAQTDGEVSDGELMQRLERFGGTPQILLERPALSKVFLPILRADMRLMDQLQDDRGAVSAPIITLAGDSDASLHPEAMLGWKALTMAGAEHHVLPGGHFFTQTAADQTLAIINRTIEATTANQRAVR